MKHVRVSPGKFVKISDETADKTAQIFRSGGLPRGQVAATASTEPKSVTVMLGGRSSEQLSSRSNDRVVLAMLHRLLRESGSDLPAEDDLKRWVAKWMRQSLAELDGRTPAQAMRSDSGRHAVEVLLGRMRGGLPA